MTDAAAAGEDDAVASRLTLRVYRVDRHGRVREDRGVVDVEPVAVPPPSDAWPACACRRCVGGPGLGR